jgi:hypothetical protein
MSAKTCRAHHGLFFLAPGKNTPNLILLCVSVTVIASTSTTKEAKYNISRAGCETKIASVCNPKISATAHSHMTLIHFRNMHGPHQLN